MYVIAAACGYAAGLQCGMRAFLRGAASALVIAALTACNGPTASRTTTLPPITQIMIPPAMAAADPSALGGATWQWQTAGNGASDRYTLQFMDDGRVVVRADCNRGSGRYTADANGTLTLTPIALTKMGCPAGSLDKVFVRDLGEVSGYRFEGEMLRLALRSGGSMTFRR